MPRKETLQPLPRPYIEDSEDKLNLQLTFVPYVWQAVTALRVQWRDFPKDVYAIGDNWAFFVSGREIPTSKGEREFARRNPDYLFADVYNMEERTDGDGERVFGIGDFLRNLRDDVDAGTIPQRVLDKVAILDRTSPHGYFSLFDEEDVEEVGRYPWGRVIRIIGYEDTLIYHVQNEVRPRIRIHISSPAP